MNTMKWLIRRELWEHKGMFLWAPIVVALVMILFMSVSSTHMGIHFYGSDATGAEQQAVTAHTIAGSYMASSVPLFAMLGFIVFFYCLGALYEERKDRSILFWKSLPISDDMTVLSKVLAALGMAPLITVAVAVVTSLVLVVILGISMTIKGTPIFGLVLSDPAFYLAPLEVLGLVPVYFLWALPTVGWLLMVSSWARSKVFLWAVGVPLIAIVIIKWAHFQFGGGLDGDWLIHNVIARGLGGLIPGSWVFFDHTAPEQLAINAQAQRGLSLLPVFVESWKTLGRPSVWIGAAVGVAMIFAAIRLRRSRDES
jgi:ABC-2 type transport system permease protein